MTPQFITPCNVRVDDKDKRNEVCDKLERIRYGLGQSYIDMLDNMIITYPEICNTFCTGSAELFDEIDLKDRIDCGTNTELFLALASMREDTDMGQYFISKGWRDGDGIPVEDRMTKCLCDTLEQWGVVNNSPNSYNRANGNPFGWERATAAEIVEYFNNK